MKKTIIRVSCLAVLSIMATGCQKETYIERPNPVVEGVSSYSVYYTINGTTWKTSIGDDVELNALMLQLMIMAREGYTITVSNVSSSPSATSKTTVIYRTTSEEDAANWSAAMVKQGYTVTITIDKETNEYVCTAVK